MEHIRHTNQDISDEDERITAVCTSVSKQDQEKVYTLYQIVDSEDTRAGQWGLLLSLSKTSCASIVRSHKEPVTMIDLSYYMGHVVVSLESPSTLEVA